MPPLAARLAPRSWSSGTRRSGPLKREHAASTHLFRHEVDLRRVLLEGRHVALLKLGFAGSDRDRRGIV